MNDYVHRLCITVLIISVVCISVCYGQDPQTAGTDSKKTESVQPAPSDNSPQTVPGQADGGKGASNKKGMMAKMGGELEEVRVAAFKDIEKQRQDTLSYLTNERKETLFYLTGEREEILTYISREREIMLSEFEVVGNRLIANAISESEHLVDYIVIRILQVAAVLSLLFCIMGFLFDKLIIRHKHPA